MKPNKKWSHAEMKEYVVRHRLNKAPVPLSGTKRDMVALLKRAGHWDESGRGRPTGAVKDQMRRLHRASAAPKRPARKKKREPAQIKKKREPAQIESFRKFAREKGITAKTGSADARHLDMMVLRSHHQRMRSQAAMDQLSAML
jgi:hypothetical protein